MQNDETVASQLSDHPAQDTAPLPLHGPFELELKIRLAVDRVDGDASKGDRAIVSYDLPAGRVPDYASIKQAMDTAVTAAQNQVGDVATVRLLTREEFCSDLVSELAGERVYVAGPAAWDEVACPMGATAATTAAA